MSHKVIFGLREGKSVHISDVERGLNCNAICPLCKSRLVAKKGSKNKHHFTHYNLEECRGGFETSLHMAAKEIILESKYFRIPDVYLTFPDSYKKPELLKSSKIVAVDKVYLEKKVDNIVPDIIIESGGKILLVEIFVTHKVDNEKLNKIKKLNISTIEIDLSSWIQNQDLEELRKLIIDDFQHKTWLYNKIENDLYIKFRENTRPLEPSEFLRSYKCPLNNSFYKGKNSIRWTDCIYCEFCFEVRGKNNCLGHSKISRVEDLNKSYEQRDIDWRRRVKEEKDRIRALEKKARLEKQRKIEFERKELIKNGFCPRCFRAKLIPGSGNFKNYRICWNRIGCGYKEKVLEEPGEGES